MTPTPSKAAILEMLEKQTAQDLAQAMEREELATLLEPYLDRPDGEGRSLTPDSQEAAEAVMVEAQKISFCRTTRRALRKMGMWTTLRTQLQQMGVEPGTLDDIEWELD